MTVTALRLPLAIESNTRELDVLTARAVRLALWPDRSIDEAAAELCMVAHGSVSLLDAAIARVDRAVAAEWSKAGERALTELVAARARVRGSRRCAATTP